VLEFGARFSGASGHRIPVFGARETLFLEIRRISVILLRIAAFLLLMLFFLSALPHSAGRFGLPSARSPDEDSTDFMFSKTVFLMPYSYYSQALRVMGKGVELKFVINSSQPLAVMVLNQTGFRNFTAWGSAGSIFDSYGPSVSGSVKFGDPGSYYLVLAYNGSSSSPAVVVLRYETVPVSIEALYSSVPAPIGIADYGVLNSSGTITAYAVRASEVIGEANITSLQAYNPFFNSPYSASLQLNAVLLINTTGGQQDYLLQNVVEFQTNSEEMRLADNIWNITSPSSYVSSSRISGRGAVSTETWVPPWALAASSLYSYYSGYTNYGLPLTLRLATSVSLTSYGVEVDFYYSKGGSAYACYDAVRVLVPDLVNASIFISGYSMTPVGNYYDAEFVFGGGYGGEETYFSSASSSLSMSYVLVNGSSVLPRYLFGFGSDTAESAFDLKTTLRNGIPYVEVGKPDLGAGFSTLSYAPLPVATANKATPPFKPLLLMEEWIALLISIVFLTYQFTLQRKGKNALRRTLSEGRRILRRAAL